MKSLDEIIENSKEVREVKRALAVKMVLELVRKVTALTSTG